MGTKAYIISLKEESSTLSNEITSHGLEPIWYRGVNGKELSTSFVRKHFHKAAAHFLSKGVIGCALSHLFLWQRIANGPDDYVFIFEDDVIFEGNFAEKWKLALQNVPRDFDLLYFGGFGHGFDKEDKLTNIYSLFGLQHESSMMINSLIGKPKSIFATHAYVISKSGARKLVEELDGKIYTHIDFCLNNLYINDKIVAYCTVPRVCFQSSTDNGKSENVSSAHPKVLNDILCKQYIDKHVTYSYVTTLSLFNIVGFDVTLSSILMLVLGVLLRKYDAKMLTYIYILASSKDIIGGSDKKQIMFHYGLFITPSLLYQRR